MATLRGLITSYDVAENKVDVSPVLSMLKMPETPLLNRIGISGQAVNSTRYEWWDDVVPALKIKLAADYTAGGGTLTVDDAKKVKVGNIIKVGDSIYRVTAVDPAANTLTIVVISDDANHTSGDDVLIIGDANPEASTYVDTPYEQKIKRFNVTQIFTEYIKFSGTQLAVQQYVNEDVFINEVKRKLQKIRILLERSAWMGVRVEPSDNSTPRMFGGVKFFISNDGITSTGTFSENNFNAFLKQIYDAGGTIKEAWMNPATKAYFNALHADKLIVQRNDTTAGRLISSYLSEYGEVQLHTTPHLPEGMIVVFDPAKVAIKPLKGRQVKYEELSKTGDFTVGQIVGEYTLEFRNPDVAGIFYVQ